MFKKKKKEDIAITVKVGRAHASLHEVALNGARSITDALDAAGLLKKDTEIVSVNGQEVDEDEYDSHQLDDGDKVILVRNVEGGF